MKEQSLQLELIQDPILKQSGVVTPIGLNLPQDLTADQWKQVGLELGRFESAHQWWIGDWWAFGEHKWGDRKKIVEAEEWSGPAYETCHQAGRVCRDFKETGRRLPILSFWYHHEVTGLPSDEANRLLDWCADPLKNGRKRPHSISELREHVKKVRAYLAQGWNTSQLDRKAAVERGETVVANMSNDKKGVPIDNALITWAESQNLAVRIDRQSDWGNPYEVDADGTREEVIEWYAEYFAHKRSLHGRLKDLAGKLLVCWCHPEACHGEFLINQL
jgi:Domain of unknown function (DUF4326)